MSCKQKPLLCSFAPRTSENLRGAVLPLLLLPASGSSDREGWFGACALANSSQKYSEGRGAQGVRKLDRKTDSDRSDRWDRRAETQSNDAGGEHSNCFLCFSHFLTPLYAHGSFCSASQEDAQIATLPFPVVLLVVCIFGYFGGAVGPLLLLLIFFLLYVPKTCDRWEATGLHGEDADSPGCQHP